MSKSSQMMPQSNQKTFNKVCTRISLEIKPVMLPFFTLLEVDKERKILKPYMAPVNHNVIDETTWIRIVHTFYGNFCQDSDDKDDMNALENMGNDACVIVGYHERQVNLRQMNDIFQNGITRLKCELTIHSILLLHFRVRHKTLLQ